MNAQDMPVTCPTCHGKKKVMGIACGKGKCHAGELPCHDCGGLGVVAKERVAWMEQGERLRAMRLDRGLGLRKAAQLLRLVPSALSAMEQGRENPAELEARWEAS